VTYQTRRYTVDAVQITPSIRESPGVYAPRWLWPMLVVPGQPATAAARRWLYVSTGIGAVVPRDGDWIVLDPAGRVSVETHEDFVARYELVSAEKDPAVAKAQA
jgi:hypothetical protein